MREMRATGYMHTHLRMYWGKKILHWSATPQEAFETTLALNNRWSLDGRDANSFTNVGWLYSLHDRPWGSQPVFGTVRSMGAYTFKKFDADAYVRQVAQLERDEGSNTGSVHCRVGAVSLGGRPNRLETKPASPGLAPQAAASCRR
jgi:deoxyribodipyrimidine photo-lyase